MKALHKLDLVQITPKNIGQVRLLNSKCFPILYKDAFYEQLIANSEFVKLGYYADCLVGTVGCKIESGRFYIMTLGVLESYRRYGFGSQLLSWAIDTAKREELSEIVLHVQTSNEAAIAFYKKHGFHVERTDNDYYPQLVPSSALYLVKKL